MGWVVGDTHTVLCVSQVDEKGEPTRYTHTPCCVRGNSQQWKHRSQQCKHEVREARPCNGTTTSKQGRAVFIMAGRNVKSRWTARCCSCDRYGLLSTPWWSGRRPVMMEARVGAHHLCTCICERPRPVSYRASMLGEMVVWLLWCPAYHSHPNQSLDSCGETGRQAGRLDRQTHTSEREGGREGEREREREK